MGPTIIQSTIYKVTLSLLVLTFTVLLASQVDDRIQAPWHVLFIPLYLACAIYVFWVCYNWEWSSWRWSLANFIMALALVVQVVFISAALDQHDCSCQHSRPEIYDSLECYLNASDTSDVAYILTGDDLEAVAGCQKDPQCGLRSAGSGYIFLAPAIAFEVALILFFLADGCIRSRRYHEEKRIYVREMHASGDVDDAEEYSSVAEHGRRSMARGEEDESYDDEELGGSSERISDEEDPDVVVDNGSPTGDAPANPPKEMPPIKLKRPDEDHLFE